MTNHPLDRTIWNTLTTRHAGFAIGIGKAQRIDPSVGLFIAAEDQSAESLADLAALVAPGETVGMIETTVWPTPPGFERTGLHQLAQMTASAITPGPDLADIVALDDSDAADMLALATLTRPGPFFANTHRLGGFVGVRRGSQLATMAGTRQAMPGYVEISAICTHPDYRGQGLGAALTRRVASRIVANGEIPFLTSYVDNATAIALYEKLGFRTRTVVQYATYMRT